MSEVEQYAYSAASFVFVIRFRVSIKTILLLSVTFYMVGQKWTLHQFRDKDVIICCPVTLPRASVGGLAEFGKWWNDDWQCKIEETCQEIGPFVVSLTTVLTGPHSVSNPRFFAKNHDITLWDIGRAWFPIKTIKEIWAPSSCRVNNHRQYQSTLWNKSERAKLRVLCFVLFGTAGHKESVSTTTLTACYWSSSVPVQ